MTKELYIASGNAHKIAEIQAILESQGFTAHGVQDLTGYEAPEETGQTFEANARLKALALRDHFLKTKGEAPYILADDSGIESEDLNGAPGIYSARFAGVDATDQDNNEKLIRLLKELPSPSLNARYVCSVIWLTPTGEEIHVEESCPTKVTFEPRGTGGFGYDPYMIVEQFGKTMAEITAEEKNQISHRGKALAALVKKIA